MKFDLNQVIYYMRENKPHSAPVFARMKVENAYPDWVCNEAQRRLFTPFGESGVFYATCHGIVLESEAYASKEEMLAALLSD